MKCVDGWFDASITTSAAAKHLSEYCASGQNVTAEHRSNTTCTYKHRTVVLKNAF